MHTRTNRLFSLLGAGCLALAMLTPGARAQEVSTSEIEVLSTGSGDKQQLTYSPKAGTRSGYQVNLKMTATQKMGEQAMPPQDLPPMISDYTLRIVEVGEDGQITTETEVVDIRLGEGGNPMARAGMESAVKGRVGLTTQTTMKKTGEMVSYEQIGGEEAGPMAGGLEQMTFRFPEEPMGVGGRWIERRELNQNGMTMNQEVTYEIESIKGDRVGLDVKMKITAPRQPMEDPNMPPGSMELVKMEGNGSGKVTVDLKRVVVTGSDLTMDTNQEIQFKMNGMEQTMVQDVSVEMSTSDRELSEE